jgi:hypothetical protein
MKTFLPVAAAFLLAIGSASAVDPPEVKEGLWSIHKQTVDNPGNKKTDSTSTICRNHAYDHYVQSMAKAVKGCTTVSQNFQGGKYSTVTHCVAAGTVIESQGTTSFQSDTSIHSETHATYTPAMGGVSDTTMIVDQRFLGNCPAGARPGDLTNADGRTTHLWRH